MEADIAVLRQAGEGPKGDKGKKQSRILEEERCKTKRWQKTENLWENFNSWPEGNKAISCKESAC